VRPGSPRRATVWDTLTGMATIHHQTRAEVAPGVWDVARPARARGLLRWRIERQCRKTLGHCWHPADAMIGWFCCGCGADEDGMPAQRCTVCTCRARGAAG
jgi:hypothetical protein